MNAKPCEICGERSSRYVCQECGRNICEKCIEPHYWICSKCYRKIEESLNLPEKPKIERLQILPMKVFFIGFALIFIGVIITLLATLLSGLKGSINLFFFIGPIPIILGTGEHALLLTIFAAIITVICVVIFILLNRRVFLERRNYDLISAD